MPKVLVALFSSLFTGLVIGLTSVYNVNYLNVLHREEIEQEQKIKIVLPVIWAMTDDVTGVTMRRFCESGIDRRTPQGVSRVICMESQNRMKIRLAGRHYGSDDWVVLVLLEMHFNGHMWKGPAPQDRYEPVYAFKREK